LIYEINFGICNHYHIAENFISLKGEDEGGYRVRICAAASSPVSSFAASIGRNIGINIGKKITNIVCVASYLVV